MPDSPRPKGLFCPNCRGVRLTVLCSRHPLPGVKVRYRACSACETRLKTQEVVVKVIRGASR